MKHAFGFEGLVLSLKEGKWKFAIDEKREGIVKGWFKPEHDVSNWDEIQVGRSWEGQGYNYDGWAWYRRDFLLSKEWAGEKVFVVLGGVDDEYEVYVNGEKAGGNGSFEQGISVWDTYTYVEVTPWIHREKTNILVIWVNDWGGYGGLRKEPVAVVSDPRILMPPEDFIKIYAREHTDLPLPYWATGKGIAWTMTGVDEGVEEILLSHDGAIGATSFPFTISGWILSRTTGKLWAPENLQSSQPSASLKNGYLPLLQYAFLADGFRVESEVFANSYGDPDEDGVAYILYRIANNSKENQEAEFLLVIRPYLVNGKIGQVTSVRFEGNSVFINDNFLLLCEDVPSGSLTSSLFESGDISQDIFTKKPSVFITDERGLGMLALQYPLNTKPGQVFTFHFRLPLRPREEFPLAWLRSMRLHSFAGEEATVSAYWEKLLENIPFQFPDESLNHAYRASIANILIAMDKGMLHPGPLAYSLFWYRDSAYMITALLQSGFAPRVKNMLPHFMKAQLESGEFPSIFDLNYKNVGWQEWDAQGQALYSMAQYYRFTRDKEFIQEHWQTLVKGAEFLRKIRKERLKPEFEATERYGILPPSVSAEDLGPGDWHHYWDDFWAIRGLKDGAFLARELNDDATSQWMEKEAQELLHWTKHSYSLIMQKQGIDWIANGPEDWTGSSMARGTGAGLWPGGALSPGDPVVRTSFQRYYEKWIQPFGGAYLHQGRFWPYGLELALAYVMLGRREIASEILKWHLDHQTFPGTFSWAEQIDPKTFKFLSGDMPHCWVAADLLNLLRGMLVYEEENRLVLMAGIPRVWLDSHQTIQLRDAPTYFGKLSLALSVNREQEEQRIRIAITGDARPEAGFHFRLPILPEEVQSILVENEPIHLQADGSFTIPGAAHQILITLNLPR